MNRVSSLPPSSWRVARVRFEADPKIDDAIDRALAATEWEVVEIDMPEWVSISTTAGLLLTAEAWATNRLLAETRPDGIGHDVLERLYLGRDVSDQVSLSAARTAQALWCSRMDAVFRQFDLLAMPTLSIFPPVFEFANDLLVARSTLPVNLAGVPALSLPVPTAGHLPASLQLVAPKTPRRPLSPPDWWWKKRRPPEPHRHRFPSAPALPSPAAAVDHRQSVGLLRPGPDLGALGMVEIEMDVVQVLIGGIAAASWTMATSLSIRP